MALRPFAYSFLHKKSSVMKFLVFLFFFLLFFFPHTEEIEIRKEEITNITPFSGRIDDLKVGSDVCVDYWLRYDAQPVVRSIKALHFGVLKCFTFEI